MVDLVTIFGMTKLILNKQVIDWLKEESKKTETPIDDWAVELLTKILDTEIVKKEEV